MSFYEYRAQKYANQRKYADGSHKVSLLEVREKSDLKFAVKFGFRDGNVLEKTFTYHVSKYGPFDALIDAALGRGATDFELQDLVGKHIEIEILNEERFTNIKRIRSVNVQKLTVDDFLEDELEEITEF
ncbi:hypothetical protein [Paenibacillus sp. PAMC21692]|uniref:hypothetical protein n=1 Tax=Paenibacillus sp. PAMC21692 TaxID=2762320 RepID=UPI00164E3701|nr:hypothetical protein [Paenibacillus sp. PAMC21692]QNK57431.1 hypothetical protein H7F31_00040 [Paenibacillus sp. PAMC21692]